MITLQNFYSNYQLHHHRAKATMLVKLLKEKDFIKAEEIIEETWGFKDQDYQRMLRVELRANLFHAIETLFTLYFCLQPDKDGLVHDTLLFSNLSKKKFYYDKIRDIGQGSDNLDNLDALIEHGGRKVTLGQYLFYFGLQQDKF